MLDKPSTVMLTLHDLRVLAETASRNGTLHAFPAIALEWATEAEKEILRLQEENAALRPQLPAQEPKAIDPWQPIDTAPKDRLILLYGRWWSDGQGWMVQPIMGRWNEFRGKWEASTLAGWCGVRPTIWTNIPEVPEHLIMALPADSTQGGNDAL